MKAELQSLAAELGERVLETPNNPISLALTLDSLRRFDEPVDEEHGGRSAPIAGSHSPAQRDNASTSKEVTFLGSMLWSRYALCCSIFACQCCTADNCKHCRTVLSYRRKHVLYVAVDSCFFIFFHVIGKTLERRGKELWQLLNLNISYLEK